MKPRQVTLEDIARLAIKVYEAKHKFYKAIDTSNFETSRRDLVEAEYHLDTMISMRIKQKGG